MRDRTGKPMFTINDTPKMERCIRQKLCSICGKKLTEGYWCVGGSRAFLHEFGVFIDPPLHRECAEYALKVCPFLAARSFSKSIGDARLDPKQAPQGLQLIEADFTGPIRPERFGLGLTIDYPKLYGDPGRRRYQIDHWRYIEWWRQGQRIDAPDFKTLQEILAI